MQSLGITYHKNTPSAYSRQMLGTTSYPTGSLKSRQYIGKGVNQFFNSVDKVVKRLGNVGRNTKNEISSFQTGTTTGEGINQLYKSANSKYYKAKAIKKQHGLGINQAAKSLGVLGRKLEAVGKSTKKGYRGKGINRSYAKLNSKYTKLKNLK